MNRRNFLKRMSSILAVAGVPVAALASEVKSRVWHNTYIEDPVTLEKKSLSAAKAGFGTLSTKAEGKPVSYKYRNGNWRDRPRDIDRNGERVQGFGTLCDGGWSLGTPIHDEEAS